ncbi:MAG TPA: nitroreductase [Chloroflexota bacterium]|nr:nitroreductase [Chloroflexota bacterium]
MTTETTAHREGTEPLPAPGLEGWRLDENDYPAAGPLSEQLHFILQYAVLAPSAHNTQPWLFAAGDEAVELYADRTRALPVIDPDDRELTISCGAALLNLRIALRRFGLEDVVELFPERGNDDLLARVWVRPRWEPSAEDRLLFEAIPGRHTSRRPFERRDVPAALLAALEGEADDEGAWLHVVADDGQKAALAELISGAEVMLWEDRRYRRELAAWAHPRRTRRQDGIPGYASGLADLKTFLGSPQSLSDVTEAKQGSRPSPDVTGPPALAVLGTDTDTPYDWLAAGQALERVLLRAQASGVSASFLNQPIEVDELRPRLRQLLNRHGYPQLMLRMGYGAEQRPTPRRPLHEVLI